MSGSERERERERFEAYLAGVSHPAGDMARAAWRKAVGQTPTLREPTAGVDGNGRYYFGWNYSDLPGLTLTLDFASPEPGAPVRVDWFFRDKANGVAEASEDDLAEVPGAVFTYLRLFARARLAERPGFDRLGLSAVPPPLELNEAVAEAICSRVEAGRPIPLAAEMAGFSADAVWKWQRQGKADLRDGVDSMQARFVQRLARARDGLAGRLQGLIMAGIQSPKEVDAKAALSAIKTFLPAYFGDRSLEVQAALEAASERPEATGDGQAAQPGATAVELARCGACGCGTATDLGEAAKWCGGCGGRLEAK